MTFMMARLKIKNARRLKSKNEVNIVKQILMTMAKQRNGKEQANGLIRLFELNRYCNGNHKWFRHPSAGYTQRIDECFILTDECYEDRGKKFMYDSSVRRILKNDMCGHISVDK